MAALTKEQIAERRKGIGGSDAAKIVSGDWYDLWLDKTGRVEPKDLSDLWRVQLGHATEELNLDWFAKVSGDAVERRGEVVVSKEYPFLRCTLDGFCAARNAVIQAKHTHNAASVADEAIRYSPQVQHEMLVTGAAKGYLSIIVGANEPWVTEILTDEFWAAEYVDKCKEFWNYVISNTPPPGAPAMVAPPPPVEKFRKVDMTGNNEWSANAATWLENQKASKKFDKAAKEIKALIAADVGEATGHGIIVKRSKAGALTIKEDE